MINLKCDFDSRILGTRARVDVYLPNPFNYIEQVKDYREHYTFAPKKTIFVFHGAWNGGEQWIENTNILRYAEDAGYALVLPNVQNSFYSNLIDGFRYEDFVADELFGFVRGIFPLSDKREDTKAIGVSMGGYGCITLGMKKSYLFSKAAVMSPVMDMAYSVRFMRTLGLPSEGLFGKYQEVEGSSYDLKRIVAETIEHKDEYPDFLVITGSRDQVAPKAEIYLEYLKELGIEMEHRKYQGQHTWGFWDQHTEECITWLTQE